MPTSAEQREERYKGRAVVRSVLNETWAILPAKLDEIVALLEERYSGELNVTETEIRERFGNERAESDEPQIIDGGIQVIDVFGTLAPRMNLMMRFSGGTSTQKLEQQVKAAGRNSAVKTVILRVDSPGGAASYVAEAAAAIKELAETKRVIVSASNMMASGAFWLGVAATEVYASPSSWVGSVGVVVILSNEKAAYESRGVKFTVLKAGDVKAAGNPYEDMSDAELASIKKRVSDVYAQFVGAVAEYRGVTIQKVEQQFGQGAVFLAEEATTRGMIDGVSTFDEVLARERQRLQASVTGFQVKEQESMNSRVKAALHARGLIESMDVSDEIATAVLNAFKASNGITAEATEQELINAILTSNGQKPTPKESTPGQNETAAAQLAERQRVMDLQSRGALFKVSAEEINQAIEAGTTVEAAVMEWTKKLAAAETPLQISGGDSQLDKVILGASDVLMERMHHVIGSPDDTFPNAQQYGGSLRQRRLVDIARVVMQSSGMRVSYDDKIDAADFLQHFPMAATSVNRSGDHPDLLSNLANKALTKGAVLAQVTYPMWCERIEDLPDFKPQSFIDAGVFQELDGIQEDEDPKQLKFQSTLRNYIQADRYANKVGLTVEMVVNDDLGGFARQLRSLATAARMTLQGRILDLLNANPTMIDGNAFFSSTHANVVSSGGGTPTSTQLQKHRLLHRTNSSYGTTLPMGLVMDRILVPAALEEIALQATGVGYEVKVAATDATINTFRNTTMPIVDANLDGYSAAMWYSFVDPMMASAIVYAFRRGYGENGLQRDWYDEARQTRYYAVEIDFGVALNNWRAVVRNVGS